MDSNPYLSTNFVDLLQSQQDSGIGLESSPIPLFGTQATEDSNFEHDSPVQRKERRSWSQTDDEVTVTPQLGCFFQIIIYYCTNLSFMFLF